jgi:hydroxymethylpyrimidine pyrophosphatase-like HAD family hydrolase
MPRQEPLKVIWIGEPDYIASIFAAVRANYLGRLEVVLTDPEFLEFTALGATKSVGISAVATRYGIAQHEVIAFGDSYNDVCMLQWAGLGIAMDHGNRAAIEAADVTAPPGDRESSFARAVDMVVDTYRARM